MHNKLDELNQKLYETRQVLESMAMELRFRGCDDNHKLIRQARELSQWLQRRNGQD
ncbi:hypothetical protein DSCA_10460 [Desulfosarcina alkanivorans]|jgi:hypothetical protein|uniref:Uncharacterized protein n=1 Tax=Desulfosarcina alkanivorans TaxID=571177 RepID=A0A5K7YDQ0_9BACT|nr:hypothetical protein [Desulfosarcina alkanivorans]BBO67116.1 hypothetical protein DSCA_10460 [Desulfosarcina alkanivorans]